MKGTEPELSTLAGRLRTLAAEGRYAEAQGCFEAYCHALARAIAGLPPGDPSLRRLEDEWQRLLDETRRRVLAGRAHAGARLARLPKLPPLYSEPSPPRHTWECSA
jgi:hypothetical protein